MERERKEGEGKGGEGREGDWTGLKQKPKATFKELSEGRASRADRPSGTVSY